MGHVSPPTTGPGPATAARSKTEPSRALSAWWRSRSPSVRDGRTRPWGRLGRPRAAGPDAAARRLGAGRGAGVSVPVFRTSAAWPGAVVICMQFVGLERANRGPGFPLCSRGARPSGVPGYAAMRAMDRSYGGREPSGDLSHSPFGTVTLATFRTIPLRRLGAREGVPALSEGPGPAGQVPGTGPRDGRRRRARRTKGQAGGLTELWDKRPTAGCLRRYGPGCAQADGPWTRGPRVHVQGRVTGRRRGVGSWPLRTAGLPERPIRRGRRWVPGHRSAEPGGRR
jgi:hypothetical protein